MKKYSYILFFVFICFFGHNLFGQLTTNTIPESQKQLIDKYLKLYEETANPEGSMEAANVLNKIAYIYWNHHSAADAAKYFLQSLEINYTLGNSNAIRVISTNLGLIYSDAGDYNTAVKYFNESLKVNKQIGSKSAICSDLINLAMVMTNIGKYNESNNYLNQALGFAKEENDIRLVKSCYSMFAENYEKLGDKEKSFEYFDMYSSLEKHMQKEKIEELETKTIAAESAVIEKEKQLQGAKDTLIEMKAETEQQKMDIQLLKQEKELQDLKIKEQEAKDKHKSLILKSIAGLVILLFAIAVVLIFSVRQKQKSNVLLANQQEIIKKKNQNILESINYAKRIQKAILPTSEDLKKLLPDSFMFFKPRDVVSGDFFWFTDANVKSVIAKQTDKGAESDKLKNTLIVSAIDCTGHGVPGAFMSMIGFNLLQEIISKGITSPEKILSVLNIGVMNHLKQEHTDNRDGMDMGLCTIYKDQKKVEFSGAKNPLVYFKNGEINLIKGDRYPIGGIFQEYSGKRSYEKHTIEIDTPTTFYLYSDGFQDQMGGERGRKFMSGKFRDFLTEIHLEPMQRQYELLESKLKEWKGELSQNDDIVIIGFRID